MQGAHASYHVLKTSILMSPPFRARRTFHSDKLHSFSPSSQQDTNPTISHGPTVHRVLVLHGKGSNGKQYRNTLSVLEQTLQAKASSLNRQFVFDYLTAPYPMPNNDKNTIIDRREWWMLPPGVRSFQAKEYIGFEDSALLVENALTNQKYDFLLGHSQGAILASILMTTSSIFSSNHTQRPYGCILNGVAWPNPFQEHLYHYATNMKPILNTTKALLIIGKMDDINPPEGGEKVRDIFKDSGKISVETIYHENGHSFPTQDPMTMEAICNWIISTSSHNTTTLD
jgi:hypothetical protein